MASKFLKIFFISCILFFAVFNHVLAQTDEERMAELKQQIEQLEQEAQKYRDNIAGEQAKAESLKREINLLKSQVGNLQIQIAISGKKIDKTSIEIKGLENTIFDKQQKIDYQKQTIADLLISLNRYDQENLFATFIKNQNLSDFLRQRQYVLSMNSGLLDLVNELKGEKKDLEGNKLNLENKKQDLEELRGEQQAQKVSLNQATTNKNNLLVQTKGQEKLYAQMLADVENRKMLFLKSCRNWKQK